MYTTRYPIKLIWLVVDKDVEDILLPEYNIFAAFNDVEDAINYIRDYKKENKQYSNHISAIPCVINPDKPLIDIVKLNKRRDLMYMYNRSTHIDDIDVDREQTARLEEEILNIFEVNLQKLDEKLKIIEALITVFPDIQAGNSMYCNEMLRYLDVIITKDLKIFIQKFKDHDLDKVYVNKLLAKINTSQYRKVSVQCNELFYDFNQSEVLI